MDREQLRAVQAPAGIDGPENPQMTGETVAEKAFAALAKRLAPEPDAQFASA